MLPSFCDLTGAELAALGPPGSPRQLLRALHRVGRWSVRGGDSSAHSPLLGRRVRPFVERHFDLALPEIVERIGSTDHATKLLMRLADGATVEVVHMPRAVKHPRVTLCISSQVGCAMGCTFCRTASMGLVRNLTAAEIVGQVFAALLALGPADPERVSLVFMGMGEPLHNHLAVLRAIRVLCDDAGLGLAPQRITVSTSGLVPGIDALAAACVRPTLALSVNATTDAARRRTMPIANRYGLADLRAALLRFPLRSHEKITLEYVLLAGENDHEDDAVRLARFAQGFRHIINLIPWNPFGDAPFARPTEDGVQTFMQRLRAQGCLVTIRRSRGQDVSGACGQLATDARRVRFTPRGTLAGP
jgi:23S rRNA (adenine2503-C2)-methyltransferase